MAVGTLVRVALALLSSAAICTGLWRCRTSPPVNPRLTRFLRGFCLLLAAMYTLAWMVIAAMRYRYPFELEWISGEMHDHCMRVLSSKPLYVPPSSSWFPYEYQPLYFWSCAILMKLTNNTSYEPMRLVSIVSTAASSVILFVWTRALIVRGTPAGDRKLTVISFWSVMAAGTLFGAYRFTGAWYDAEHLDMLFVFLVLFGGYLLQCAEDGRISPVPAGKQQIWQLMPFECSLLAGVALALAFFTKQPGAVFILAAIAALAVRRSKVNLATFATSACGICATGIYVLNRSTHDWYSYYCFHVPLSNGIKLNLVAQFVIADIPLFAPFVSIILVGLLVSKSRKSADRGARSRLWLPERALFTAMFAAAFATSLLSRAHWGGYENVLIPIYLFLGIAACAAAARWEACDAGAGLWLCLLAATQLLVLVYRPDLQVPHAHNYAAGIEYRSLINSLQREGEVLCIDHGGFTSPPHFQTMGLIDVAVAEKRLPQMVQSGLDVHRYSAIVMDAPPPSTGYLSGLLKAYPHITRIGITDSWVVTGFSTPSPQRPVFIMRP